jgi:hypothetical protein
MLLEVFPASELLLELPQAANMGGTKQNAKVNVAR